MTRLTSLVAGCVGLAFALGVVATAPAFAQASPFTKPVRFIIPYPPGGPTDLTGRSYADKLTKYLGQPVVVENKPGAQGVPAVQQLMQLPADGHTIYFGTLSTQVVSHVINSYRKLPAPYDARKDLVPVNLLGASPLVVVASLKSGINSYKELAERLKAEPGKLNYGSDGMASLTHLGGEMLNQTFGTQSVHIPYKGTAEFSQALIAGDNDFAVMGIVGATNLLKQNRIKVLAVAGPKRSGQLPGVPTTAELGHPGVDLTSWFAAFMKAGTPKPFVDAMAQAITRASTEPDLMDRLSATGVELGVATTPEKFSAQLDAEFKHWAGVVEKAAIKFD
ncbi:Bug family tripartite tricarboxylate transporter substrate binding protein [Xenophilus azovorans]|uniref:Bug family tripartite tricarboxylate transporter substrate binding protein n=1 Tax=Xenophilus azovorans TaxID=151755 RepID=UPI000691D451|nr:tripartite tricarboxylate transporter substrate-binding protein [Xenophilus azovorans]